MNIEEITFSVELFSKEHKRFCLLLKEAEKGIAPKFVEIIDNTKYIFGLLRVMECGNNRVEVTCKTLMREELR